MFGSGSLHLFLPRWGLSEYSCAKILSASIIASGIGACHESHIGLLWLSGPSDLEFLLDWLNFGLKTLWEV